MTTLRQSEELGFWVRISFTDFLINVSLASPGKSRSEVVIKYQDNLSRLFSKIDTWNVGNRRSDQ